MALDAHKKALVWNTLNKTRGKIEPAEYKNYVFGIMFYKYLSSKAQTWWQTHFHDSDDQTEQLARMQTELGYVIQPGDLFTDWQDAIKRREFTLTQLADALERFDQHIAPQAQTALAGIFADIDLNSSRLGNNQQARTQTTINMIDLMGQIELDEESDVLGDLYEYLIGMFSINSGTKSGEFYTPHQVSEITAQILTAGREELSNYSLYDPAIGSGSLLLTTASHMNNAEKKSSIKYYGQELITTTYNLARMNLLMHGIAYQNIVIRNADTLTDDWPDGMVDGIDSPRLFDAVTANPPYSLRWDNTNREHDPRFKQGIAPKSKADYAFLLHCLYHLKPDGRMVIVLSHGVLFRGGAEYQIRKNLLKDHNISAVIGLPKKIFTNTSIPTVILVLEKQRQADDVLFIDASQGFEKVKNNNKLRQQDIEKIVSTYLNRMDVAKYAHVASMEEIINNDYNLNIPRYVDSLEETPPIDVKQLSRDIHQLDEEQRQLTKRMNHLLGELVGTDAEAQETLDLLKDVFK
ncbi:type I restriction-modification system subunit M [Fructilactobacillus ixorae]|uniref:site-specific DNA-methyltransferase (adenine-specific) n=1 Tax=Fructilactobacillus ixorae TaxID=1750535 RepID=A0ABY5C1U7_9LACO|nr:type I restriction-modification system subunit M [Fructilactobacillus ixorae]USS92724.1 type I restriction-modification system subunit M [Fructilactobacillus ixorae]